MGNKRWVFLLTLVVSLVILIALLAGCSSTASPTPTQPAAPTTTAPVQTTPVATTPVAANQPVIKLIASSYLPPTHFQSVIMGDMLKEIQDKSNGRLQISYAAGGSILTAAKVPDGLDQGLADIGLSHIGYTPGRFPVTEALDLPIGYPSSYVGTNVALDYLAKFKPAEWNKYQILLVAGGTTASLNMAKTLVTKLEDLQGKTLRGAGEVADAEKALGAVPRDMPMTDVYEAMSKGTIDGLLVGAESLKSFKLADVTKYTAYVPSVGNQYLFYIAMNKAKWDSLGPDLQKLFTDVAAKYQTQSALAWTTANVDGFKQAISQGAQFTTLSDSEAIRWKASVQPVMDAYVTKMVGKGFSEQQAKDQVSFIKDRIDYWTGQAKANNIPSEGDIK